MHSSVVRINLDYFRALPANECSVPIERVSRRPFWASYAHAPTPRERTPTRRSGDGDCAELAPTGTGREVHPATPEGSGVPLLVAPGGSFGPPVANAVDEQVFRRDWCVQTYVPSCPGSLIAAEWQARRAGGFFLNQYGATKYVSRRGTGNPPGGQFSAVSHSEGSSTYLWHFTGYVDISIRSRHGSPSHIVCSDSQCGRRCHPAILCPVIR